LTQSRLRLVFLAGAGSLGLLVLLGLSESLLTTRALPPLEIEYVRGINGYVEVGRLADALRQMRLALQMDDQSLGLPALLEPMERLAHALGDRDSELLALRRLHRIRPNDARVSSRLAALLSTGKPSAEERAEAARAAEAAGSGVSRER
jgi:hypothetical protein